MAQPVNLDRRLRAIRRRRRNSRLSGVTALALWLAGLGALLAMVGGGFLSAR